MNKTIIINNGSASKKYALYEGNVALFNIHYEQTPTNYIVTEISNKEEKEEQIDSSIFKESFSDFIDRLLKYDFISYEDDIDAVALRIVAPGKLFQEHRIIDKNYLVKLDDICELSPLHITPVKKEISEVRERLPKVKLVAVSDSSFHKTMGENARMYAFPCKLTEELELYRYGYHGLSVASVVRLSEEKNSNLKKVVVCHLGGGSSITAVKNGQSVDTSMGFSPLEGVPMATRAGSADPNALISLINSEDFTTSELQEFLYHECGLKGISGTSGDTRIILEKAKEGDKRSQLALSVYIYQIVKTISSYYPVLGGLDAVIFTGTIGVRSAWIREQICEGLSIYSISIDLSKNKLSIKGEADLSSSESKTKVLVIPTAEIDEMAQITNRILK